MADETKPADDVLINPKPSRAPLMLGIGNTVATIGVLIVVLMKSGGGGAPAPAAHGGEGGEAKQEAKAEGGEKEAPAPSMMAGAGPTLKMSEFIIHLRNPEAERYAKLTAELELVSEADREKVTTYLPRIRDAFVGYLSDRTAEELAGSEALAKVKASLLRLVEDQVPGKRVRAIYFTDFVVQ